MDLSAVRSEDAEQAGNDEAPAEPLPDTITSYPACHLFVGGL